MRVSDNRGQTTQTAIEFAPKVVTLCKRNPRWDRASGRTGPLSQQRRPPVRCRRTGNHPPDRGRIRPARCCAFVSAPIEVRSLHAIHLIDRGSSPHLRRVVLDRGRRARSDRTTHAGRRRAGRHEGRSVDGNRHELIVDDTTRGTSQRYIDLSSPTARRRAARDAAHSLPRDATVEVLDVAPATRLDVETSRAFSRAAAPNAKALTEIDGCARDPARR